MYDRAAVISACKKYRYQLSRQWRGTHDPQNWHWMSGRDGDGNQLGWPLSLVFIMLNPSTADADIDDPTIRKCVKFAKRLNYEKLVVVNLFAYRTPSPKVLLKLRDVEDPIGPHNSTWIREAIGPSQCGKVICAWGRLGAHQQQDQTVMGWLDAEGVRPYCLHLTKTGDPGHPLYLPDDSPLLPYNPL